MKKVLLFAVIAMFLMVPMSFAKTAITESDMDSVTAQEGVTIDFTSFTLGAITIDVQAWGDVDGCSGCTGSVAAYTGAGWVGATDISIPNIALGGSLTIDVGTNASSETALIIGLPTITLSGSVYQTVALGTSESSLTQVLGTSYMSGLSINPTGHLIIKAH